MLYTSSAVTKTILADLHIHSVLSDGKDTLPQILTKIKKKLGKKDTAVMGLADHHFLSLPKVKFFDRIEVIPGIEISALCQGASLHLLGYSLEPRKDAKLESILNKIKGGYNLRAKRICAKLKRKGIDLGAFSSLRNKNLPGPVYAYDIADKLKKHLKLSWETEALDWAKKNGNLFFIEEENFLPAADKVIDTLSNLGYKTFWAHPGTRFLLGLNQASTFESMLLELKSMGLDGIEAFCPAHSSSQTKSFLAYAKRNKFVVSGGSDYHGLGRGISSPQFLLPEQYMIKFRRAISS